MESGQDLYLEMQGRVSLLDAALKQIVIRGREHAKVELIYKTEFTKKMLIEREKGTPVTIINDICKGDPHIAQLRFNRDCAEVSYKAGLEAIQVQKLQMRILESQIEREYRG